MTDAHPAPGPIEDGRDGSPQHIAEIRQRWEAVKGYKLGYTYIGAAPVDIAFLLDAYAALLADNAALSARVTECEAAETTLAEVSNYCISALEHTDAEFRGKWTPPELRSFEEIIDIINPPTPAQEAQMHEENQAWLVYINGFKFENGARLLSYREWYADVYVARPPAAEAAADTDTGGG